MVTWTRTTTRKELVLDSVSAECCVPDCRAILGNIPPCQHVTITRLWMWNNSHTNSPTPHIYVKHTLKIVPSLFLKKCSCQDILVYILISLKAEWVIVSLRISQFGISYYHTVAVGNKCKCASCQKNNSSLPSHYQNLVFLRHEHQFSLSDFKLVQMAVVADFSLQPSCNY